MVAVKNTSYRMGAERRLEHRKKRFVSRMQKWKARNLTWN